MAIIGPLLGALPDTTVRAVMMDDVAAVVDLMCRVSMSVIGEPDATEDEVRDDLIGPRFDIARDTALAVDATGRALVYVQAYDEHDDRAFLDVFVEPELADDVFSEVAGRATTAALGRLREALAERGGKATTVSAGLYQGETRMLAAYRAAGLRRERVYWRMRKVLEPGPMALVDVPERVAIHSVDPDEDDVMAEALQLRNETFAEHHGHVDLKFGEFAEVWRSASKYDRDGWWFAYLDDVAVGLCLCDETKAETNGGYVRTLGVTKPARGKGIARALLQTSFAEYQGRGRTSVLLGVDSANETGATRLYENAGMTSVLAIDALEMRLAVEVVGVTDNGPR